MCVRVLSAGVRLKCQSGQVPDGGLCSGGRAGRDLARSASPKWVLLTPDAREPGTRWLVGKPVRGRRVARLGFGGAGPWDAARSWVLTACVPQ